MLQKIKKNVDTNIYSYGIYEQVGNISTRRTIEKWFYIYNLDLCVSKHIKYRLICLTPKSNLTKGKFSHLVLTAT